MYTKQIPFKDFNGKPRNQTVAFNLETREVFKLLVELNAIFQWTDSLQGQERDLSTEEVVEFYNNFESVLLSAWGELSEDGLHFRKTGRYEFEESKLFAACMELFVSDVGECQKLLKGILPEGMEEIVRKQGESLEKMKGDPKSTEAVQAEIERLQAQLPQIPRSTEQ